MDYNAVQRLLKPEAEADFNHIVATMHVFFWVLGTGSKIYVKKYCINQCKRCFIPTLFIDQSLLGPQLLGPSPSLTAKISHMFFVHRIAFLGGRFALFGGIWDGRP